jgi:hypothetical protein
VSGIRLTPPFARSYSPRLSPSAGGTCGVARRGRLAALPHPADAVPLRFAMKQEVEGILRELIADAEARLLALEQRDAQAGPFGNGRALG